MRLHGLNNAIHRDLGYLLVGATILYAISGIALNHADDWDPNFVIKRQNVQTPVPKDVAAVTRQWVLGVIEPLGEGDCYRSHDFPTPEKVKIYLDEGSVFVDLKTGKGIFESVRRRPLFYQMNSLHISPKRAWLAFSDFFAVGLVIVSVTGLFVLRGRKGITGRGAIFAGVGSLISLVFLLSVK
ncbi:MAG TPA: PepSY-associated TM helix domain-containing protein [Thermoguttaceae bacterium]|nr:PepSY-associated TM helix domain-containing protein [Thermoguttaceae bacterium]